MNQRFSKWIPGTLGVRLGGKLNLICNDDNSQMEPNGPRLSVSSIDCINEC